MAVTSLHYANPRSHQEVPRSLRVCPYMLGKRLTFSFMPLQYDVIPILGVWSRIGMHLLFYGKHQVHMLEGGKLEGLLREQSIKVMPTLIIMTYPLILIFSCSKGKSTMLRKVKNPYLHSSRHMISVLLSY